MFLIIGVLFLQYSSLNNSIIKNKINYIEKSREIVGQEITSGLREHSQIIFATTEFIKTGNWDQEILENYFKNIMTEDDAFSEIYFGEPNNNLITGTSWTPPPDYDLRKRPWYEKAIEEDSLIYSEAYIDAISNKLIITISKPVYDNNNNFLGVASGDIMVDHVFNFIKGIKSDTMGYSFLMDGKGHVLAHPSYEYKNSTELKKIDEISDGVLNEMKKIGTGRKQIILDDVQGYLYYQPIKETDWIVGSFISLDEYNEKNYPIWTLFMIVLIIAIIIFGGFFYIQSKYLLKPLILLEKDIEAIDIENKINYRLQTNDNDPFFNIRGFINVVLENTEGFFHQQKQYQEELLASHEELEASYGQLSAMEHELRDQYDELGKREKKLYHLSHYDQLTNLANRRFFELEFERLDKEENYPLALIMADVNGLKLINDSFGHEAGDKLLKNIGHAMKVSCEENQLVSRIGGDEFIILLPNSNMKYAEERIREIRKIIGKSNLYNIELSVSFGIGIKFNKDENISDIIRKAEDNMYSNKLIEGPSMRSRTIDTIVQTLYEKNPREEAHSHRVSELCKEMGVQLEMSKEKMGKIEKVGLLHDIGKVAISDTVLEKPGALTKEEFEEIKRHPEVGYRILSTINEMSEIAEYVLAHHERYDGNGYPKGLKGDEIPLISRIIGIADSYDAMISDRPYRKGLSEDIAVKEIIKNAGTQFDPNLAKIFIEGVLEKEWIEEV